MIRDINSHLSKEEFITFSSNVDLDPDFEQAVLSHLESCTNPICKIAEVYYKYGFAETESISVS